MAQGIMRPRNPEHGLGGGPGGHMTAIEEAEFLARAIDEGALGLEELDAREQGILEDAAKSAQFGFWDQQSGAMPPPGPPPGAPDLVIKDPPPPPDRPAPSPPEAARKSRSSSTTTSTKTKSSPYSSQYGSMAEEAIALMAEREAVDALIEQEGNALREFDAITGAGDFYKEDQDVALMRALAKQLEQEPVGPYSNIAAQVAMVDDPNFAGVFDKAVNARINAARKHFARTGSVARMAQTDRQAQRQFRSRQRQRGDQRLKGLQGRQKRIDDALFKLRQTQDARTRQDERDERQGREAMERTRVRAAGGPKPSLRHPQQAAALAEVLKLTQEVDDIERYEGGLDAVIDDAFADARGLPRNKTKRESLEKKRALLIKANKRYKQYTDLPEGTTHVKSKVNPLGKRNPATKADPGTVGGYDFEK